MSREFKESKECAQIVITGTMVYLVWPGEGLPENLNPNEIRDIKVMPIHSSHRGSLGGGWSGPSDREIVAFIMAADVAMGGSQPVPEGSIRGVIESLLFQALFPED